MSTLAEIDGPLDSTLFTGRPTSTEVPSRLEVAIGGHAYRVDHAADLNGFRQEHFARRSEAVLRAQADTANIPGEQSINRSGLWRRTQETWHHGSGQVFFDRADSDSARFNTSKGVNTWTKSNLSLLNDTTLVRSSAATNLRLTSAGSFMYLSDGNSLLYSPDVAGTAFTAVTGTPGSTCQWLTTDGYTVYAAYGASGVYTTTRGAAAATSYNTLPCTLLGYVKGRLMAANGPSIYNILSSTVPTALLTQANTDFTWVGFAEGPGYIYAAGFSGARSLIYKIGITTDGTALTAPIVAGELPTGETVRTVKGYLGFLLVGTDLGLRVATIGSSGDLTFGSLISTPSPVLNFEPADKFVWYGLTNYDVTSTGLGRVDLSQFNQPLTPAYASDLMATAQGSVLSVSSSSSRRVFSVSGVGIFVEATTKVPAGTLSSGRITYGIADDKVAMFLDLRHAPLAGSVAASLLVNGTTSVSLGSSLLAGSISNAYPLNAQQSRGEFFELTLTLAADAVPTLGPVVTRTTLRSYPAPTRSFTTTVPLIFHHVQVDLNGSEFTMDVEAERSYIENLCRSQELVTYQEPGLSYAVIVEDFTFIPIKTFGADGFIGFDGTLVVNLRDVNS